MFLTFFVTLGVFLLLAARKPIQYRLVIAFAAWHSIAHSATMLIQTVEAYRHGAPRDYKDVILFGMIGIVVLLMVSIERRGSGYRVIPVPGVSLR
jgi:hypothetical protein